MKWPWRRSEKEQDGEAMAPRPDAREAQRALNGAHEALDETLRNSREVHQVAESLRRLRERNHFSEMMLKSFGKEKA